MLQLRARVLLLGPILGVLALSLGGCEIFKVDPLTSTPMNKDYARPLGPGEVALERVTDRAQYPDFGLGFGEKDSLIKAIDGTLDYFKKPSSTKWFPYKDLKGDFSISHQDSIDSLRLFKKLLEESTSGPDLNQRIVDNFDVFRSKGWNGSGEVLFTGYCQPIYDASTTATGPYEYPLYALPPELVKEEFTGKPLGWRTNGVVGPSPKRKDFDDGALNGRGLEIYWLKSPLEVYIVQVQGSAKLNLPNGEQRAVGYAGKTEHPYVGLGQSLVKDGKVDRNKLNLAAVKRYFAEHPDQLTEYTQRNESYVFFTDISGGPFGSLNIEVTPYRTLATDKAVFPRGGVAFAVTQVPTAAGHGQPLHQFLVDQDTGGAISSAGRADIFLGTGPEAESIAGSTYAEGRLFYIYAKPGVALP